MNAPAGIGVALFAAAAFAAGRWAGAGRSPTAPEGAASPAASAAQTAAGAASEATWAEGVKELVEEPPSGRGAEWLARLLAGDADAVGDELEAIEDEVERTGACLEIIAAMGGAAIRALMDTYFGGDDPEAAEGWMDVIGDGAMFAFMQRWAEVDAGGLLSYAKERWATAGEPSADDEESMSAFLVMGAALFVAERHPEQALALADQFGGEMGAELKGMAIHMLARSDAARALGIALATEEMSEVLGYLEFGGARAAEALPLAMAIEDEDVREEVLDQLLEPMFLNDPEGTFELFSNWPNPEEREEWQEKVLTAWTVTDPEAALAALHGLSGDILEAEYVVFFGWAQRDPRAALAAAKGKMNDEEFRWVVGQSVGQLPPSEALGYAEFLSPEAMRGVIGNYLAEDPAAALRWVAEDAEGKIEDHGGLAREAGQRFAAGGAGAVREALALLAPDAGELRAVLIEGAMSALAYNEPLEAQALLAEVPEARRAALAGQLAEGWTERDPAAAVAFALADGAPGAAAAAWKRWALFDPGAAHASMVAASAGDPAALAAAVADADLAGRWARFDPAAAAHAMLDLPVADAAAGEQLATVMAQWVEYDPAAASGFAAAQLAPGPVRDAAVEALANGIASTDPDAAAAWRATLGER